MSDPGSVRYSLGAGVLTVANDLAVFISPGGVTAEEWSDLALAPASEAELKSAIEGDVPSDHHVAIVQLFDGGRAMRCTPGQSPVISEVRREAEGRIRFGMVPAAGSPLWIGSGVVGASGLEIQGFEVIEESGESADPVVAEPEAEPERPALFEDDAPLVGGTDASDVTLIGSMAPAGDVLVVNTEAGPELEVEAPELSPPVEGQAPPEPDADQTVIEISPPPPVISAPLVEQTPPPPPVLDPPILSTSLFPDVPIEKPLENPEKSRVWADAPAAESVGQNGSPVIRRAPTPPPPGTPAVILDGTSIALVFDDGQKVPLKGAMAVGRAPEGSEHAPPGATIVVVTGEQVSRCHFVVRPKAGGAEVVDTNSLNGCFVEDADRPGTGPQIPVGVPVSVEPGQRLRFGDRSLTVVAQQSSQ